MKDTKLYEQILGISSPWYVEEVALKKDQKEVEIKAGLRQTKWACPKCQKRMHIHEYKERRWHHLDTCQFKTIITAKVPRVQCKDHGTEIVTVPWAEKGNRFTMLFERFAIDVLLECSIAAACDLLRITWDEADTIKQRAVKRGRSRKKNKIIPHIGVDEKGFRGHNCVTLVADTSQKKATVEFVSDGNTQASLDAYWEPLTEEQLTGIKSVSIDMWGPYKNSILINVPDPLDKIVYDRFHIMKHMNQAVNDVRILEHNIFNEKGDETLKGTRQIWLYGEENLPEKYKVDFEQLKEKKLKTGRAWAIKELLRDFWDCTSVDEGTTFLKGWYSWAIRSKLEPVKKVARMVKKHMRNIVSYFNCYVTNAALEGLNNKVQALIKKAYGYRNKERFKTDILFHCGGLNLNPNISK